MNVFVFKTDIETPLMVGTIRKVFNDHPVIYKWSVDTEDVDKVLRVVADESRVTEREIIQMTEEYGFFCRPLPD